MVDIGPGQVHTLDGQVISHLSQICIDALHDGTATYQFEGTIDYKDIFGETHRSGFCGLYAGTTTHHITPCEDGKYTK
jgi:hypothetical protein